MPHPNIQCESALEQLKAIISHFITSHLGGVAEFHLAITFCHVVVESDAEKQDCFSEFSISPKFCYNKDRLLHSS